jgi:hypothetical protein
MPTAGCGWKCLAGPVKLLAGKGSFDSFGCRFTSLKMTVFWLDSVVILEIVADEISLRIDLVADEYRGG